MSLPARHLASSQSSLLSGGHSVHFLRVSLLIPPSPPPLSVFTTHLFLHSLVFPSASVLAPASLYCLHFSAFCRAHAHIHSYTRTFYHARRHFSSQKSQRSALNHSLISQGEVLTELLRHARDSPRGSKFNPAVMFCLQLHVKYFV